MGFLYPIIFLKTYILVTLRPSGHVPAGHVLHIGKANALLYKIHTILGGKFYNSMI